MSDNLRMTWKDKAVLAVLFALMAFLGLPLLWKLADAVLKFWGLTQ